MYLFGLPLQKGSIVERMAGRRECDGWDGSRRMRIVLRAARIAVSRRGSFLEVLLMNDGSAKIGFWNAERAESRSPTPWAMIPSAYSTKHWSVLGPLSPRSSLAGRSSFRVCFANSQSLRPQARNISWRSKLQYRILLHSNRV